MKNFKVTFYKYEKETDKDGKQTKTGTQFLGSIVVDDQGTSNSLTVTAKAFRQANDICLLADKVTVEQV